MRKWKLKTTLKAAAGALTIALLAGCASNKEQQSADTNATTDATTQQQVTKPARKKNLPHLAPKRM